MQNICDEELNDDNNYPANIDWGVDYALTVYHTDGSVDNYSAGHLKQFGADQYGDDEGLLFGSQEAAQERIDAFRNSLLQDGETYDEYVNLSPQPQTSLTIIDQKTGQIKALVGGRGQKTTNRGLNRAYKGSTVTQVLHSRFLPYTLRHWTAQILHLLPPKLMKNTTISTTWNIIRFITGGAITIKVP